MPCLLVVSLPRTRLSAEDYDVICALPVGQSPGARVVQNNPTRFAFVWISDKTVDDPEIQELIEPDWSEPNEVGKRELLGRRRRKLDLGALPGQLRRFHDYHEFQDAPASVKLTHAEARLATSIRRLG